jgi:hypothetical protein
MITVYVKDIKKKYEENPQFIKAILIFAFFLSLVFLSPLLSVTLDYKPELTDFSSHIISNGSYNDFDISVRVGTYYKSFLAILISSLVLFGLLKAYANNIDLSQKSTINSLKYLYNLSIIGIFSAVTNILLVDIDLAIYILFLLTSILFLSLKSKRNFWDIESSFWVLSMVFPFSIILFQYILKKYSEHFLEEFRIRELLVPIDFKEITYVLILLFLALIFILVASVFLKNSNDVEIRNKKKILFASTLPILFIIPLQSIVLECFNIINVRTGVLYNSPFLVFFILLTLGISTSFYLYLRNVKRTQQKKGDVIVKYYFPLFLIGLAMMIAQPWKTFTPENEFFEFANHGLSVDHFFRYGKIPVLETFDAHMLSNQIFAYLYGFLNGYEPWAPFLYVSFLLIIINLVIYYLLKRYLNPYLAFTLCLCFPIMLIFPEKYIISCILALTLLNVLKNSTKRNFYWFWISIIFLCLYQLDIGYPATIGGVAAYFSGKFFKRESYEWKKLLSTFAITFGTFFLVFILLSFVKDINPFLRLNEFLTVAMSNQNFTFTNLGNTNHGMFRILYYILPLAIIGLLTVVFLKGILSKNFVNMIKEKEESFAALVFFIFFSIFFLFNLTRGIVRHSYMFQNSTIIAGTFTLAIGSFIFIYHRKNNISLLLSMGILFFLLINFRAETLKNLDKSAFSEAVGSKQFNQQFQESYSFNGSRVTPGTDKSETEYLKSILDCILNKEETYFDFSSTNYYHALVGRKNPLYVNQTPILLNGDRAQENALNTIKSQNIKVVLMSKKENQWFTVDAIPIDFKYYILSEYIYKNFTPLISLGAIDVFVAKDKKANFETILTKKKLLRNDSGSYAIADFSFLNIADLQVSGMNIKKTKDSKLALSIEGPDPLVIGLLNQTKSNIQINTNSNFILKFKIYAEKPGSLQLFTLEGNALNFSEENSRRYELKGLQENEIALDLKKIPKDLRIDIEGTNVIINEIGFYQNQNEMPEVVISKNVDYDLGGIPVVWGNLGSNDIFEKVKDLPTALETTSMSINLSNKDAKDAYYLFFEATAVAEFNMKAELYDQKKSKKIGFLFKTKKGKNKYALRLSSNYEWWNASITNLSLSADNPIKMHKFALISADGRKQFSNLQEDLRLSNITDEFWYGGVGLQFNKLLMNYSQSNVKLLQSAKKIQFTDGRRVSIKNYQIVDNFIHVEIIENVETFKEVATYPNTVELIK